jgi:ABC-type glycerol-3-phosphate transport system permease component
MRQFINSPVGYYGLRALLYITLTAVAFLMLFPFIYMMMTSLKTSNDVFHSPPRLLPYSPVTLEQDGEAMEQFLIEVDGETRTMVLTGEKVRMGFFTDADGVNFDNPRESVLLASVPLDDATELGEVELTTPDGETESFDEFEVTVDGETQTLLLAYRGALDVFVDPTNPDVTALAVARTAQAVETVEFQWGNYPQAVFDLNLNRALVNTTLVTIGVTIGQLVTSIFGGYAFSRLKFKGRDSLFVLYLGSIMIPFIVLVIPMYRLMVVIGWQAKLVSLIVPWIFTAYGTFLMRQFFQSIPKELEEAALMDGASRMRILWGIFVPLSTPAVATLGIFSFLYAWNSFLWPLLIIGEGNDANHVLTLSLISLSNRFADQPNFVLTGAAVAVLPPIIIFVLAQRYFIEGVASSGLKG